jgi:ribosomal protein S19
VLTGTPAAFFLPNMVSMSMAVYSDTLYSVLTGIPAAFFLPNMVSMSTAVYSDTLYSVLTGTPAAFFLPVMVSMSMATPSPQVEPFYYIPPSAPVLRQNSRLQELYRWKTVDFIYPNEVR